jgi:hypothetical protein
MTSNDAACGFLTGRCQHDFDAPFVTTTAIRLQHFGLLKYPREYRVSEIEFYTPAGVRVYPVGARTDDHGRVRWQSLMNTTTGGTALTFANGTARGAHAWAAKLYDNISSIDDWSNSAEIVRFKEYAEMWWDTPVTIRTVILRQDAYNQQTSWKWQEFSGGYTLVPTSTPTLRPTASPTFPDAGEYFVEIKPPGAWPSEISWTIDSDPTVHQYSVVPTQLFLVPGTHTLKMHDSYGDGWNGAQWVLRNIGTPTFEKMFNGCPAGSAASTSARIGALQFDACKHLCSKDPSCNAIEVNGCTGDPILCSGSCFHFYGSGTRIWLEGTTHDGRTCGGTNGEQQTWRKPLSFYDAPRMYMYGGRCPIESPQIDNPSMCESAAAVLSYTWRGAGYWVTGRPAGCSLHYREMFYNHAEHVTNIELGPTAVCAYHPPPLGTVVPGTDNFALVADTSQPNWWLHAKYGEREFTVTTQVRVFDNTEAPTICPTSSPTAYPTTHPTKLPTESPTIEGSKLYLVHLTSGLFPDEVFWQVDATSAPGTSATTSTALPGLGQVHGYSATPIPIWVPVDQTLQLTMMDLFGDGWNGATLVITKATDNRTVVGPLTIHSDDVDGYPSKDVNHGLTKVVDLHLDTGVSSEGSSSRRLTTGGDSNPAALIPTCQGDVRTRIGDYSWLWCLAKHISKCKPTNRSCIQTRTAALKAPLQIISGSGWGACMRPSLGFFSPAGSNTRTRCPEHSTTKIDSASNIVACLGETGYYHCESGVCSPAGFGFFSKEGDNSRQPCPSNTNTRFLTAGSIEDCVGDAGYYSSGGQLAAYWRMQPVNATKRWSISGLLLNGEVPFGGACTSLWSWERSESPHNNTCSLAIDSNASTYWVSGGNRDSATSTQFAKSDDWWGYHFGRKDAVKTITVRQPSVGARFVETFHVESSNDGTNWTRVATASLDEDSGTDWKAATMRFTDEGSVVALKAGSGWYSPHLSNERFQCPQHSSTESGRASSITECVGHAGWCNCAESGECEPAGNDHFSPPFSNAIVACPNNSHTQGSLSSRASQCLGTGGYWHCQDGVCDDVGTGFYSPPYSNQRIACPVHSTTSARTLRRRVFSPEDWCESCEHANNGKCEDGTDCLPGNAGAACRYEKRCAVGTDCADCGGKSPPSMTSVVEEDYEGSETFKANTESIMQCVGEGGWYGCQHGKCMAAGVGFYSNPNTNKRFACPEHTRTIGPNADSITDW